MSFLSNLFSGAAGELVKSVGNVVDNVVTTKEEKMQIEQEIKKADLQYQLEEKKLGFLEKQAIYDDISGARKMNVEVQNSSSASWLSKNVSPLLAILTTVITFALFGYLMLNHEEIPPLRRDIILYILGVLSATLTQIYSYYFGSSAGSAEKNKMLESLGKKE